MHCAAAHICMHACTAVRRSNVRLSSAFWLVHQFRSVRQGWLFLLLWSLDTSYWAYFLPSPTRFRPDKYAYDGRQMQTPIVDLTSHCPPGTMSSVLFAKHVNFEHSVSSPLPVITSRREDNVNNKTNLFWPCRGFLLVADRGVLQLPSSAALIFRSCPSQGTWKSPRTFAWIDYRVERHWFFSRHARADRDLEREDRNLRWR